MKANDDREKDDKQDKSMTFLALVVITGLFGGILWSSIGLLAYFLNFTDVHPRVILEPWALGKWKKEGLGTVISLIVIGLLSIGVSLMYYALLRKLKSIWVGAVYGIALFIVVFILLNPLFPSMKPFGEMSRNTIITSVCLYILYGVFIGYSISYEESERRIQQKKLDKAAT